MGAFVIDSFAFSRAADQRDGVLPVAGLQRLTEDTANTFGELKWTLRGGADKFGHARLDLTVKGVVQLTCQRCLTPFDYTIDSASSLLLARDEQEVESIDAALDNDEVDVIVGSNAFNVIELIEDEALLALPLAPKHEECPDQATLDALKASARPSPFEALKNLKQ